ncbi:MAG: nitroreductase family deazaflavin-dependent oxidoreductase [Deltaproteobacteria bacterium]|nr:nitroreductase family deazaflavin-dependent oxidoreductase [Deltaproteobacteria bacterium]
MPRDLSAQEALKKASYLELTTRGRKSGKPRTVELSYVVRGDEILCLAGQGGEVQWCLNLISDPNVSVRVGTTQLRAKAVPVLEPEKLLREILKLFREKYGASYVRTWYEGTKRAPVRIKFSG